LAPQPGIFLERLPDRPVQRIRQLRIDPPGGRGHPVQDGFEDDSERAAGERLLTGRHLVEHGPEREQIGAMVHLLAPRLLR
jgi:hypothetical protein